MSVHCPGEADIENAEAVRWYQSSPWAERGFCKTCGSSLFWRLVEDRSSMIIVSVDSLDDADDIKLHRHIYADAMPDRYQFGDHRPRISEAELMVELGLAPGSNS